MKNIRKFSFIFLGFILILIFASFNSSLNNSSKLKDKPISKNTFLLDTFITLKLFDTNDMQIIDEAFELCKYYENLFSRTIETSDIYRINHSNNEFVEVSPETIDVINKAIYNSQLSDGIFDITIGAVVDLWDFKSKNHILPNDEQIKNAVNTIDYTQIEIEDNKVRLSKEGSAIDLGAIAKGYIADKMAGFLNDKDVYTAIISLGGNVLTLGEKEENKPWIVGIQKPFAESGDTLANLTLEECSVVTSGIYERYFYLDDNFYHHIFDIKTGYPVKTDIVSVSIISKQSTDGDALSTLAFGLGLDKGIDLIESIDDVEALFITEDKKIYTTSGIGSKIPINLVDNTYVLID